MFIGRINLDAQIDNFANTRKDIISSVGAPAAQNLLNKALFTIIIGSNDFINNYFTPFISIGKRMLVPPETFVGILISKFRLQLTRLYKLDARKILVTNVGPIGCIPYMRDTNPSSRGNCTEKVNKVAKLYNAQLKSLIIELTANLGGSKFVYADSYYIVKDIIQNYASYGFENANSSCCHLAGRHGGLLPCVPLSKVCPDRSKYFFWDAYHPSDAANVIISKRLMDGNDSRDIWPMNIRQLVDS
ncbi:GDSL esterase/lipase At4g16230-like isoform X1 [Malania oleifera]|nr:GDSL esterase/lipase At4g16230-like isoform X1 [Malania oleifera]XP_057957347.1 GDSL esterase/lipase At4g16230-like isoform X1 [Malania oleifera]XP_057957348.1 GDSL esterase/lipase At4g16230-like isoform X1 [Malania oleifera]XP_057957349.1 GDSL esterase/lipase At4g16230-like isoform X1 [Malania oleifera]